MFDVGDEVVCVNDTPIQLRNKEKMPLVRGQRYVVAGWRPVHPLAVCYNLEGNPDPSIKYAVLLEGVPNLFSIMGESEDWGWNPHRFRKIDIGEAMEKLKAIASRDQFVYLPKEETEDA